MLAARLRCLALVEPTVRRTLVVAFQSQKEASPAAEVLIGDLKVALAKHDFAPAKADFK